MLNYEFKGVHFSLFQSNGNLARKPGKKMQLTWHIPSILWRELVPLNKWNLKTILVGFHVKLDLVTKFELAILIIEKSSEFQIF